MAKMTNKVLESLIVMKEYCEESDCTNCPFANRAVCMVDHKPMNWNKDVLEKAKKRRKSNE